MQKKLSWKPLQTKRFKIKKRNREPSCRELPIDAARVSAQLRKRHERHGTAPDAGESLSVLHNFPVWLVQTHAQGEREKLRNINGLVTSSDDKSSRLLVHRTDRYKSRYVVPLVCFVDDTKKAITCVILLVDAYVLVVIVVVFFSFSLLSAEPEAIPERFSMLAILALV